MAVTFSPAHAVTKGPAHHFFGYYGICPWSASQQHLICLESSFHDRPPEADDTATVGMVDMHTGSWIPLAVTSAWNLQQGTMLHWMPTAPDSEIIFNDREGKALVSRVLNVHTGEKRTLPRPVSAVSHSGSIAASLNYARMFRCRRVVGYAGGDDPTEGILHPEEDGLSILDLETGDSKLIVSMSEVYREFGHPPEMQDHPVWFNHVCFNPADTRLFFLARFRSSPDAGLNSAMFTVGSDGSDLRKVIEYGQGVSHFEWRNNMEILVTMNLPGQEGKGKGFILFTDGRDDHHVPGEDLLMDGHPCFSPDGRWLLSDRGPRDNMQLLRLYDMQTGELTALGEYYSDPQFRGDIRCDLHPRWNRTGTAVCFDSVHGDARQVYVIDLDLS